MTVMNELRKETRVKFIVNLFRKNLEDYYNQEESERKYRSV